MSYVCCLAYEHGDPQRLTRGMDYQARLCGIHEDVKRQPYLFWCRGAEELASAGVPKALNLESGTCVDACPTFKDNFTMTLKKCLEKEETRGLVTGTGPAGVVESKLMHVGQNIVQTWPYETELFAGRYCLPTDSVLKGEILGMWGPLNPLHRAVNSFGSFHHADVWWILLVTALCAVILSMVYLYLIKLAAKHVLGNTILIVCIGFLWASMYFLGAIISWPVDPTSGFAGFQESIGFGPNSTYEETNPFYSRYTSQTATTISIVFGAVFFICFVVTGYTYFQFEGHIGPGAGTEGLIDISFACMWPKKDYYAVQAGMAFVKYLLVMVLMHNMTWLVSIGWIDDRRIFINGQLFEGASKIFYYDWSLFPWILVYIYGCVWVMEVTHAFGQFATAYATVAWYCTPKENGKKVTVNSPLGFMGTYYGFVSHLGSIIYGAAVIPWPRIPRVLRSLVFEYSQPGDNKGACCGPLVVCNCCCRFVSSWIFTPLGTKCCDPGKMFGGVLEQYHKNAYTDTIIRSNHFKAASEKAAAIMASQKASSDNRGRLRIVTHVGVITLGSIGFFITYQLCMASGSDPSSGADYIQDPLMVSCVGFYLAASICYNFVVSVEHAADTMLYCFAWIKKFKKGNTGKYVPDEIRGIVGRDDLNADNYPYYGGAEPTMYLSTYVNMQKTPAAAAPPPKEEKLPETKVAPAAELMPPSAGTARYNPFQSSTSPRYQLLPTGAP
eukprot:TRINITY_DN14956_c0_g1_i1.p1 TRINITY_DN14956_c0_g1~~TRINITY_DN14956_c0_g1_i1.p1  ORF type:complete len:843 (+),score=139.21 TRINITY_DN14956_c0_g1_i1:357-2531(+)